ncbi:MAG: hypothetical protein QGH53_02110 [Prochlorococcaceae cyanobacterium ETNP18_MAG_1]|nr:hypothetical protein [Prochlorococcaceae cyanobacterium ETNP18_MAG_1]
MKKRFWLLLSGAALLVLAQQQLLIQRPPRLIKQTLQSIHSGNAAVDFQFSRPMQRQSVADNSRIDPQTPHRWLGENNPLRLILDAKHGITVPLRLMLSGKDRRGLSLQKQTWLWDPRPWIIATRMTETGEQIQLQDRDGHWIPISPTWTGIQSVVPFGNGRGIAVVSRNVDGDEQVWLQRLRPRSLTRRRNGLGPPTLEPLQSLANKPFFFAHLSSNLNGDLLLQTGGFSPGSERFQLIGADGRKRSLKLKTSGPVQLLPSGGGLVVPTFDGLSLRPIIDNGRPVQLLPGSRNLGAFCAASGRAVLIRHWPDYRRSIELVIPGLSPKQLHLGEQAILAVSCDSLGEHIWAVLGGWSGRKSEHEIVLFDRNGKVLKRRLLTPWSLKAGAPLQFDPVTQQLLMTIVKTQNNDGRAGIMDAFTLEWRKLLSTPISEAQWLPAG